MTVWASLLVTIPLIAASCNNKADVKVNGNISLAAREGYVAPTVESQSGVGTVGEEASFRAFLIDYAGEKKDITDRAEWVSSYPKGLSSKEAGKFTAIGPGNYTVGAKFEELAAAQPFAPIYKTKS